MNTLKKAAIPLVAVVAFIASWIGIVQYFTPREIHAIDKRHTDAQLTIAMQGIAKQFEDARKDRNVDNAMRDVQFWTQQEASLRAQIAVVPYGTARYDELKRQIDMAVTQRCAAQRNLMQLKGQ